jgi:AmmeMemoRadiSam system protein A
MGHLPFMDLDVSQRRKLLELGRKSIELGLEARRLPDWSAAQIDADLQVVRASFATLKIDGMLRGCCGTVYPARSLAEDVWRNAWASAFSDPRFPPLARSEYPHLELHVSILSALEAVQVESEFELLEALRPGTDGLLLELDTTRATFLPAVWEQLPEPRAFLRHLKEKAGWPAEFWTSRIRVYRYTTQGIGADALTPGAPG